jgi:predicted phosphoribosyltransferase
MRRAWSRIRRSKVARALGAPLDVLVVRKLGAPGRPELGIGARG